MLKNRNRARVDLTIVGVAAIVTWVVAGYYDLAERWIDWAALGEFYQLDEIIFVLLTACIGLMWFGRRRYLELQATLSRNLQIQQSLKATNQEISTLLSQNRALIKHITSVREAERLHLARELHDVFGQHLAAIDVNISVAKKLAEDHDKLGTLLNTVHDSANYLREVTRSQLRSIRPPGLASMGLSTVVEDLLSQWQMTFPGIELNYNLDIDDSSVNYEAGLTIYRCLQEGLSNVSRHANAGMVDIDLTTFKSHPEHTEISLVLRDDGKGIDPEKSINLGLGLIGIRERCHALDGRFELKNNHPTGTVMHLSIPLD
ncbi:two-component sensor histidine kinase [Methylophaga lonarensis MPL]|uniref:histidine kinase n=1 Tax=Methylophaga lonarensis MPL TaxID=1286106 RepID=M7NYV4_9GAMM|nr:histidine kinase [Methylophaga lonarensis]EMR12412.1 two-component sensor histidine kinase [Methylophaga lonarensis MPL]